MRVRQPRTGGHFGFSIGGVLGAFESSDSWGFVFVQAEGGGGCGWQRVQALRLQEVQMLEAVRKPLFPPLCFGFVGQSQAKSVFFYRDSNSYPLN